MPVCRIALLSFVLPLGACDGEAPAGPVFTGDGSLAEERLAVDLAERELGSLLPDRGFDPGDLRVTRVQVERSGLAHVRLAQTHGGVPVFGAGAIVHLEPDGSLRRLTDHLVEGLDVDTVPEFTAEEAVERAVYASVGWGNLTADPQAELVVLRHEDLDALVWKVQLHRLDGSAETSMPLLFIDAHTGQEVWRYENLHTASGTGTSNYSGTVNIKVYRPSGDTYYYLENPSRDIGTYSFLGDWYTASYVYDTNTSFTESWQREAVDAHFAAESVWGYYYYTHGWDGLDDAGGPGTVESLAGDGTAVIASYVNYGTNYANAFWTGSEMVYGDGDGVEFDPLTTLDIAGHEMTHGVTQYTAAFTYYGESGALDEGLADVFGAMVERYVDGDSGLVWKMGEDAYTPGVSGDAMRYLSDPNRDGFTVSHYDDLYTGSYDSGGAHINMGIVSLAFYLLSEGGDHPDYGGPDMTGVGEDAAADIAFRALHRYLDSSSDFADAQLAFKEAAQDLYGGGSDEENAVRDAWALVGLDDPCEAYEAWYSHTLSTGGSKYFETSAGYTATAGSHLAYLEGPSGADFDLYLQKYDTASSSWKSVSSSTGSSSTKTISYSGTSGKYRWRVKATSGSGDLTMCVTTP